jgi:hypothetical protein
MPANKSLSSNQRNPAKSNLAGSAALFDAQEVWQRARRHAMPDFLL